MSPENLLQTLHTCARCTSHVDVVWTNTRNWFGSFVSYAYLRIGYWLIAFITLPPCIGIRTCIGSANGFMCTKVDFVKILFLIWTSFKAEHHYLRSADTHWYIPPYRIISVYLTHTVRVYLCARVFTTSKTSIHLSVYLLVYAVTVALSSDMLPCVHSTHYTQAHWKNINHKQQLCACLYPFSSRFGAIALSVQRLLFPNI